jgi:hypothetical protein
VRLNLTEKCLKMWLKLVTRLPYKTLSFYFPSLFHGAVTGTAESINQQFGDV